MTPWWKSALTLGQMVQFVLMNAQAGYLLVVDCQSFPRKITEAYLYYILTLLALFAHFFVDSYVLNKKKSSGLRRSAGERPNPSASDKGYDVGLDSYKDEGGTKEQGRKNGKDN